MVRHTRARTGATRQTLQDHALAYADAGWPVIPIRPGTKRPATPNHTAATCNRSDPRCVTGHTGWEERATTDPGRIIRAWDQRPWGIGIACGPAGLVVIDLDIPKHTSTSGADSLRQLEHDHNKQMPATFTAATPSGGRHLYYLRPRNTRIRNSASAIAPAIDIRATGGYVVAPPTTTTTGAYEIIDDHPPAILPDWFTQLLTPPTPAGPGPNRPTPAPAPNRQTTDATRAARYVQAALDNETRNVTHTPPGQRSHALNKAAYSLGGLVGAGHLTHDDAETALEHAASHHYGIPGNDGQPFTATEAKTTIAAGLHHGAQQPRHIPDPHTRPTATRNTK